MPQFTPSDGPALISEWNEIIESSKHITGGQLRDLLGKTELSYAVGLILSQLAVRMLLTSAQIDGALEAIDKSLVGSDQARRDLLASRILKDGLKGPLYKLHATLDLDTDWASALAIQEVLPWYTNNARQMILASDRPDKVKSLLIKIVNAHSDEMRQTIDF